MLTIKNITLKNFMSIGSVTQGVRLENSQLTLVLGENVDLGSAGSRNGVGKAQPLDSTILTPDGWVTMEDIKVGDIVVTPGGNTAKVIGEYPQGKKDIYKFTFADGRTVECCEDHLWKIYSNRWRHAQLDDGVKILSTKELVPLVDDNYNTINKKKQPKKYVYVPLITPAEKEDITLPIDPWVLGFLLGDGSFSKHCGVGFTTADEELFKRVKERLPDFIVQKSAYNKYGYNILSNRKLPHPLRILISKLGLYDTKSHTKFIPNIYKHASVAQKLELIKGLIDSDGYITKHSGAISVTTTSITMAKDIQEIIWSVGGIARISSKTNGTYLYKGLRRPCKDSYTVSIRYKEPNKLVSLSRKKQFLSENYQYSNLRLRIIKIEKTNNIKEAKCIQLDSTDQLYITDNYVVTHNTSLVQGIAYALFGSPITNIKRDNLINKTNAKNMLVTIDFEKNGNHYRIERGRKPGVIKFLTNNKEFESNDDGVDEAHGESRVTQLEIERVLGFSRELFKHIIALNTFTEPFLSQSAALQRTIIEELLGVTQLSKKAELLKERSKQIKEKIIEEEYRIKAIIESNNKIQTNIESLKLKSSSWLVNHNKKITQLKTELSELQKIDIENEISCIKANALYKELESALKQLKKDRVVENSSYDRVVKRIDNLIKKYKDVLEHKCPTCGSELHDESHQTIIDDLENEIKTENDLMEKSKINLDRLIVEIQEAETALKELKLESTHYDDLSKAYLHRSNLDKLIHELELEGNQTNPYEEQIKQLETSGLVNISYEKLNELTRRREHQEFLWKLLTNKDSFIRKKIVDQNLSYLNHRLNYYLEKIGLPHEVKFLNDLSVEISELGRDYDFDNLSRGEKNRLILSLSFAFRDIWESLNEPINLLFIDELIDSGLDQIGVESSLTILKNMGRDRGKDIFLISHREELLSRVSKVMVVKKENGFTSFVEDVEDVTKLEYDE